MNEPTTAAAILAIEREAYAKVRAAVAAALPYESVERRGVYAAIATLMGDDDGR